MVSFPNTLNKKEFVFYVQINNFNSPKYKRESLG